MTPDAKLAETRPPSRLPFAAALIAILVIPLNFIVWSLAMTARSTEQLVIQTLFVLLAVVQLGAGLIALDSGNRQRRENGRGGLGPAVVGGLAALGAVGGGAIGLAFFAFGGGAWGRPLRIRGRQLHPELREGSDWTQGARPNPSGLDEPTRAALEALWLHDAQKEHASVPAFSRISWMLAAVGAPAELLEWSHRAALEEISHTRLCFALAAGYAGRSHTVEPMPDLLLGGLDVKGVPFVVLATESLSDGCQLEDFNADVAAECALGCEEPATRAVLEQVAREERSHAEFSWALLNWLISRDRATVEPAIRDALAGLDHCPRPTAVSAGKRTLVDRANPAQLLRHGRLPDARWGELWDLRLTQSRARTARLLAVQRAA